MAETFNMQFCNTSSSAIEWSVTPVNAKPIKLDQEAKQYSTISVPSAKRYMIRVGDIVQAVSNPSVLSIYTGEEIVTCTPA